MLIKHSHSQTNYIRESLKANIRIDGRKNNSRRTTNVTKDILKHLIGSSHVSIQYENIQMYTGIKLKISQKTEPTVQFEISSMVRLTAQEQECMLGMQNIIRKIYLTQIFRNQQTISCLKLKNSQKHSLSIFIDVFILSKPQMYLLQLVQMAIASALSSTLIPQFQITYNKVTQEEVLQINESSHPLVIPSAISLHVVGIVDDGTFVVDMRQQEYESVDGCIALMIEEGKVTHMEQVKGRTSIQAINKAIKFVLV